MKSLNTSILMQVVQLGGFGFVKQLVWMEWGSAKLWYPDNAIGDCDAQVDYVYLAACGGVGYLTGNWSVILGCLQSGGGTCNPDYNTNITAQPCR